MDPVYSSPLRRHSCFLGSIVDGTRLVGYHITSYFNDNMLTFQMIRAIVKIKQMTMINIMIAVTGIDARLMHSLVTVSPTSFSTS